MRNAVLILSLAVGLCGCGSPENGSATTAAEFVQPVESGTRAAENGTQPTESDTRAAKPSAGEVPEETGTGETLPQTDHPRNWEPEEESYREPEAGGEYRVISVEDWLDKTTSGLIAQFVGTLSGYEFWRGEDGKLLVGMPDDWFELCNGPYAKPEKGEKLRLNEETGIMEVWTDDDYHVDILNQYLLADAFEQYGTVSSKTIRDGWVNYDVWDMGGGHRDAGAHGLAKKNYLPPFTGGSEYGNNYSWCTETYIENETLGLSAAGMPNTAADLATVFCGVTGDQESFLWARLYPVLYSMAYFENDIPTLIRDAQRAVLPEDSWPSHVVDLVFEAHEMYPDNWRNAAVWLEKNCFKQAAAGNDETEPNVNNAFVLMSLLYGGGDYTETCKIASLAGYDGDCTAAQALSVIGIIRGMKDLPAVVNEKVWQDGRGVVRNAYDPEVLTMYRMCMTGLPEYMPMADLVTLYRQNFEHILLQQGGKIEDGTYYIPKEELRCMDSVFAEYFEGEDGLGAWEVKGDVELTGLACTGNGAAEVNADEGQDCGISTTLTGLKPGAMYCVTAFVQSRGKTVAYLYAKEPGAEDAALAVAGSYKSSYYRRDFIFRATAETMEVGFAVPAGSGKAFVDDITVVHILENRPLGDDAVSITSQPGEDGAYKGEIEFRINGRCEREAYLKVTFANPANAVVDVDMTVNGEEYATVPFYGMNSTDYLDKLCNCTYIPVILSEDTNSILLDTGSNSLFITDAQIVTVRDRF